MNSKVVALFNFLNALLGGAILYVYFSIQPKIDEMYLDLGQQLTTMTIESIYNATDSF